MEPTQSSSSDEETLLLDESTRYGKKAYTFFKNVLQELVLEENEMQSTEPKYRNETSLERAQRYTGLHIDTIKKLANTDVIVEKHIEIDRKCIHDMLMSIYLGKKKLPTSTELFNYLQSALPFYEDIRSFRKKLVKMGYIFKKKGTNFVVFEDPSIRFERFLYLKNILQYRTEERHIYFMSKVAISYKEISNIDESDSEKLQVHHNFLYAVSSLNGVQFLKKVSSIDKINFNSWLFYDVIPNLETRSVIILHNTTHQCDTYCETPKKSSPRYQMIDWLKFHQIPFSETMSRVELYILIEKFTDLHINLYKPDIWLKQNGHDVLRLPNCIHEMTPAAQVRQLIINSLNSNKELPSQNHEDIIKEISEKKFVEYNSMLAKEENRLYNLEIKLDAILDKLESTCDAETNLHLPYLSDSD